MVVIRHHPPHRGQPPGSQGAAEGAHRHDDEHAGRAGEPRRGGRHRWSGDETDLDAYRVEGVGGVDLGFGDDRGHHRPVAAGNGGQGEAQGDRQPERHDRRAVGVHADGHGGGNQRDQRPVAAEALPQVGTVHPPAPPDGGDGPGDRVDGSQTGAEDERAEAAAGEHHPEHAHGDGQPGRG